MKFRMKALPLALGLLALGGFNAAQANGFNVQCPGDINLNGQFEPGEVPGDKNSNGILDPGENPNTRCRHVVATDGFVRMGDTQLQYIFGFFDAEGRILDAGNPAADMVLGANFPAPTVTMKEGEEVYLSLSNLAFAMRPDLFDAHTVHFHGFPNASTIFDGEPEAGVGILPGATITYYYNIKEPGTFMYHCHAEAAEHMQMGMLGNLYVHPKQDDTAYTYGGKTYTKFVYNDGDGSTGFDVEYPIQIGSFDPNFHDASVSTQTLPFADMHDRYPMLNGRGYPDTVQTAPLAPIGGLELDAKLDTTGSASLPASSQKMSSLITATQGQTVLLRISNLNVTTFYTLATLGLPTPMKVIGTGARQLRGPTGADLSYYTNSVTLGGGETADVLIDTRNIPVGTYYLYTTNLNYLSNNAEDFGGMMTEIHITAAAI